MTSIEKAKKIIEIADAKKGFDIELIEIADLTSITDYFVICSANSDNQVKSIADEIEFKMKNDNKLSPSHIEGYNTATWILLDYNDVIVHILNKESRMFYSLEKLLEDANHIDISELIKEN